MSLSLFLFDTSFIMRETLIMMNVICFKNYVLVDPMEGLVLQLEPLQITNK